MGLLEGGDGKNGILTVVFASLFLVSIGVLSHNAFADNVIATIKAGPDPSGVAVNPTTNMIYVREQSVTGSIDVINGSTNTWQSSIGTPSSSRAVAVNPSTNTIYFTNGWGEPNGTVSVVNGYTNGLVTQIPIQGVPGEVGINPATNTIYVLVPGYSVVVINGSSNTVVKTIPYGKNPYAVAVNPNTNKIYIADGYGNTVTVIDGSTSTVTNSIPVGSVPQAIAVDKVTNMVYAANAGDDTVSVIDGSTNSVVGKMSTGSTPPVDIAANPVTNKIYVALQNNTLLVVNGTTDKIIQSLVTAGPTNGVGVNPNTNRVYTSDLLANAADYPGYVSVIDGSAPAPTPVLSAPSAPQNLQANSGNAQVMLTWQVPANQGSSAITNYNIYRGTSSGNETFLATNGTATSYTDNKVTKGQTYFYKVTAVNSVGESPRSNETSTIPLPPHNFEAHSGTGQVYLTWENPAYQGNSITNYKIYKGTSSGNETFLTTVGNTYQYTDSAVIDGQVYIYKATAVNWFSESAPSDESGTIPNSGPRPSSPTNLTATAGNGQVTLSWGSPSSNGGSAITKYTVSRGTSASFEIPIASLSANTTTYTDTSAAYGVTYYYYVMDYNSAGFSFPSNEVSATLMASMVPNAPTNLTATGVSQSQINLSWTAPSNTGGSAIMGYKIERLQGNSTTWSTTVSNTASTATTYSDTGLAASTSYTYRVSAINSVSTSQPSNTASATTPSAATVPGAPTGLTATGGNAQVTLSWTAPSNTSGSQITGYNVYRGTTSGGEISTPVAAGVTSTTYTDTGLTNGQTYYYTVRAVNSVGSSPASNEASAAPKVPVTVPSAPTGLSAAAISSSQINLSWTAPSSNGGSAITNYNVYRGTLSGNETLLAQIGNVTSYADTAVTQGQTYYYKVAAVNSVGASLRSSEASATSFTVPQPPANLAATSASSYQINLNWNASSSNGGSAISGYMIQRSADGGSTWFTIISDTNSTSTTYHDSGLLPNTTYAYKVAAINSVGASVTSNTASATTFATVSSAPTGLTATGVSPKEIDLSWNTPTNNGGSIITGYKTMISTDGSSFTTLASDTNSAGTTYSAFGLHPHTTYYFEVSAINSVGTSASSNIASAATR